jgi:hypothetical protein
MRAMRCDAGRVRGAPMCVCAACRFSIICEQWPWRLVKTQPAGATRFLKQRAVALSCHKHTCTGCLSAFPTTFWPLVGFLCMILILPDACPHVVHVFNFFSHLDAFDVANFGSFGRSEDNHACIDCMLFK